MIKFTGAVDEVFRFDGSLKTKWAGAAMLRCTNTGDTFRVCCTNDVLTVLEAAADSNHEVALEPTVKAIEMYSAHPKGTVHKFFCDELPLSGIEGVN